MIISHVRVKNWRNFGDVNVKLGNRAFLVGPNACGKSNFLDVFRFLRDVAKAGGGLQKAVQDRGGLSKIRCLAARRYPDVEIEVELAANQGDPPIWKYGIGIKQEVSGYRIPFLAYERIWKNGTEIRNRPDDDDQKDKERLTQTHLEQIGANQEFRDISRFFESILYMHLVPQLLRNPDAFSGPGIPGDPFGRNFLERVAKTPERTRNARLRKIQKALVQAVPQLKELTHVKDESGIPHLEAKYKHWRYEGAKQREEQFSDGTLRLIALLWCLMEGEAPLLLEEPELSLNAAIVRELPAVIYRLQKVRNRQVIISTHSADLLTDKAIGGEEAMLLKPDTEGTNVQVASNIPQVRTLLEEGFSVADALMPHAEPKKELQGYLFDVF
jgi:predicted ATPase